MCGIGVGASGAGGVGTTAFGDLNALAEKERASGRPIPVPTPVTQLETPAGTRPTTEFSALHNPVTLAEEQQAALVSGEGPIQANENSLTAQALENRRARQRFGRGSTILTGGLGLSDTPAVNRRTLIGA